MKKVLVLIFLLFITIVMQEPSVYGSEVHYYYHSDFEGLNINRNNTVDKATNFIWAENYVQTETIKRGNNTLLQMPIVNSTSNNKYSIVGGFGIASNGNLANLKNFESYTTESYLEIAGNVDYLFIEFVGGIWGSVKLYPDGKVTQNEDGENLVDVSYQNNILKFTFTYTFNSKENVNGYIKFTAYNASDAYLVFDDVKIYKAGHALKGDMENYSLGKLSPNKIDQIPIHLFDNTSAEIKESNNNKYLSLKSDFSNNNTKSVFYFNKLGFLIEKRLYTLSFDIEFINVETFYLIYGGDWLTDYSYLKVNPSQSEIELINDSYIKNAKYDNGKITITFEVESKSILNDNKQFLVNLKPKDYNNDVILNIDNLQFDLIPIVESIVIDSSNVKKDYLFGESLNTDGLLVYGVLSNGNTLLIDDDFTVLNYDPNQSGNQYLTVNYQGFIARYEIHLTRPISSLRLNLDNVKTTYNLGEDLDLSNLEVSLIYEDGGNKLLENDVLMDGYFISYNEFNPFNDGTYQIYIHYHNIKETIEVNVNSQNILLDYTMIETGNSTLNNKKTNNSNNNLLLNNLSLTIFQTLLGISIIIFKKGR